MSINKYNKETDTLSLCAGATRTWVGTQDALATALANNEIPANTIIGITDDQVSELAEDVYSTDEVQTNKVWIDGKPIYRKVYVGSTKNTMSLPDADDVISISGIFKVSNTWRPFGGMDASESTGLYGCVPTYQPSIKSIGFTVRSWSEAQVNCIVEYTKTTD